MDSLLVLGAETVVGANLAATLADRFEVSVAFTANPGAIHGCRSLPFAADDLQRVRDWVAARPPNWIVVCGPGAHSSWDDEQRIAITPQDVALARSLAQLAHEQQCRLTLISSDAVFTGPWLFHAESSPRICSSQRAEALREIERVTQSSCPGSLVIRTNTYGWASQNSTGWIERLIAIVEGGSAEPIDCIRHASPILASDLAEILARSYKNGLQGTYHVASAERINPSRFAERIAEQLGLPRLPSGTIQALFERPTGFGRGETSLATKCIRNQLGIPMPMIAEGIARLFEQQQNGYCERLGAMPMELSGMVA